MAESAIIPDYNSNLCLMAALFKHNWEDPVFEFEHVVQPVLESCPEPFRAMCVLICVCVCVCELTGCNHCLSFPFPPFFFFYTKTIPPKTSSISISSCFCFKEQCDVLRDQLIWMYTLLTTYFGSASGKTHSLNCEISPIRVVFHRHHPHTADIMNKLYFNFKGQSNLHFRI